jgi:hypothetical protein
MSILIEGLAPSNDFEYSTMMANRGRSIVMMALALSLAITAVGCEDKGGSAAARGGQLGAATFTYVCGKGEDPQCNTDSELAQPGEFSTFPRIAVGAAFGLGIKPKERQFDNDSLKLDFSETLFEVDEAKTNFKGKSPGVMSILANYNSETLDLTWLEVVKADHIKLIQGTPDGKFKDGSIKIGPDGVAGQANVQFTFKFRAVAADKDDKLLAGALPCMWTTSDAAIANITSPPTANIVTVVSGNPGTATVHVTLGDMQGDITLKVN